MSNPSPLCLVDASSTLNGVDVTAGASYTIALADTAGVKQWSIICINTDELHAAATVTGGLTVDNVTKTATGTAPAAGSALIFKSVVNNGKDANGVVDPSLTTTFGIYVPTSTSFRVAAFDEKTEGSAAFGWITKINNLIRNVTVNPASAGAGLTFSAGAYNVGQNADGSIVVNADDVQLKPAYQTLLNGATSSATASTLPKRDGSGNCSFSGISLGQNGLDATGYVAFVPKIETYAASLTLDGHFGSRHDVILTGNVTLAVPTNFGDGSTLEIFIEQDATGSRTATWNGVFVFSASLSGTLIGTAQYDVDVFIFKKRNNNYWVCVSHTKHVKP